MNFKFTGCFAAVILFFSGESIAAIDPAGSFSLSPDENKGYPRIRFQESDSAVQSYYVQRVTAGNQTLCPGDSSPPIYNSATYSTSCTRWVTVGADTSQYTLVKVNGVLTYTDKSIRMDETDPVEYVYQVSQVAAGTPVIIPAASCQIDETISPIDKWLSSFNKRIFNNPQVGLSKSDIPAVINGNAAYKQTAIAGNTVYVYADNKYIAVFNRYGNPIGLTHKALGEEFFTYASNNSQPNIIRNPQNPGGANNMYDAGWSWKLMMGNSNQYDHDANCDGMVGATSIDATQSLPNVVLDPSGTLKFTWTGLSNLTPGASVSVAWNLEKRSDQSGLKGRFSVNGATTQGGFLCAAFPKLVGLGMSRLTEDSTFVDFVAPNGLTDNQNNQGTLFKGSAASQIDTTIRANAGRGAQFVGYIKNGKGLYVGTNDSNSAPMKVTYVSAIKMNTTTDTVFNRPANTYFDHYPSDGTGVTGNSLQPNYDVILRPMCGSWQKMAKYYRGWALQAPGVSAKKSSQRTDIDDQYTDGLFWWLFFGLNSSGSLTNAVQIAPNNLKAEIGPTSSGGQVPIGLHLYEWYGEPYTENGATKYSGLDKYLPKFTTKPFIPNSITQIQSDGTSVIPYVNTNAFNINDRTSPTYADCPYGQQYFEQDGWFNKDFTYENIAAGRLANLALKRSKPKSVNQANEDYYATCYKGSKSVLIWADPSSQAVRSVANATVNKVVALQAKGIYLDTYGIGYNPDFNAQHSHVMGHGAWWLDGQKLIGQNMLNTLAANGINGTRGITSSEYFNEALMSYTDIILNYEPLRISDIPVLWSIYSGYQMYTSGQGKAVSDMAKSALWGRSFVWGAQLGPVTPVQLCGLDLCPPNDPSYPVVPYVRKLAQARNNIFLRDYLSYGELLDLADDQDIAHLVDFSGYTNSNSTPKNGWCASDVSYPYGDSCTGKAPAVRGARWKHQNNSDEIILLTNTQEGGSVTASIKKPRTWDAALLCEANGLNCSSIFPDNSGNFLIAVDSKQIKVVKKAG
ncbi:MAG: DUF6259 domain-containing protein [Marinagarivorans sp.]